MGTLAGLDTNGVSDCTACPARTLNDDKQIILTKWRMTKKYTKNPVRLGDMEVPRWLSTETLIKAIGEQGLKPIMVEYLKHKKMTTSSNYGISWLNQHREDYEQFVNGQLNEMDLAKKWACTRETVFRRIGMITRALRTNNGNGQLV